MVYVMDYSKLILMVIAQMPFINLCMGKIFWIHRLLDILLPSSYLKCHHCPLHTSKGWNECSALNYLVQQVESPCALQEVLNTI